MMITENEKTIIEQIQAEILKIGTDTNYRTKLFDEHMRQFRQHLAAQTGIDPHRLWHNRKYFSPWATIPDNLLQIKNQNKS